MKLIKLGLLPSSILTLFHHEDKRLVVVGIQVGVLHRGLFLFADAFSLGVEQLDLDIGI